jgi:hypothetical protein
MPLPAVCRIDPKQTLSVRDRPIFARCRARGSARYWSNLRRLDAPASATLLDLSQTGVGMLVREPVTTEGWVEIELVAPATGRSLTRRATVRWRTTLPDGWYRIGCRWDQPLTLNELQEFV